MAPLEHEASGAALAYWIEKSASDEWTYRDLQRFLAELVDAGGTDTAGPGPMGLRGRIGTAQAPEAARP